MMKFILFCAFTFTINFFFSQNFAYSFAGDITLEQQKDLIEEVLKIPTVSTCEMRYKSDSKRGEILFFVDDTISRSESSIEFSPAQVKSIFISNNIEPLDFRKIK